MLRWLWLSALVLVLDQASKLWVDANMRVYESIPVLPFFSITYVQNTGAAFSLLGTAGGWQRWLFAGLALVMSVVFAVWLGRLQKHETWLAAALALVTGGAVGNLIDRLAYGHVIDFADFHLGGWHFATFNLADAAISLGALLMLVDMFVGGRQKKP